MYGRLWVRIRAVFGNRFIFSAEVRPEKSGLSRGPCYKKQVSLKNAASSKHGVRIMGHESWGDGAALIKVIQTENV